MENLWSVESGISIWPSLLLAFILFFLILASSTTSKLYCTRVYTVRRLVLLYGRTAGCVLDLVPYRYTVRTRIYR